MLILYWGLTSSRVLFKFSSHLLSCSRFNYSSMSNIYITQNFRKGCINGMGGSNVASCRIHRGLILCVGHTAGCDLVKRMPWSRPCVRAWLLRLMMVVKREVEWVVCGCRQQLKGVGCNGCDGGGSLGIRLQFSVYDNSDRYAYHQHRCTCG